MRHHQQTYRAQCDFCPIAAVAPTTNELFELTHDWRVVRLHYSDRELTEELALDACPGCSDGLREALLSRTLARGA